MSGILPSIIFPNDIRVVQSRLAAAADGVQKTVDGCPALDPNVKASWEDKKKDIDAYTSTEVSIFTNTTGTFYERGLSLEEELDAWQAKLEDAGCALTSPRFVPKPPQAPGIDLAEWVIVGVVAVAGAYTVSRIAPIILAWKSPKQAAPAAKKKAAAAPRRRYR